MVIQKNFEQIQNELRPYNATLVAVSKMKPVEDIQELFNLGQRLFGENYVQELKEKQDKIPNAEWHFIGHLQSNKVKHIAPFVSLIHGIDSYSILKETDKQAKKFNRIQDCLLQIHIAKEETKFGFSAEEADAVLNNDDLKILRNIRIRGLMGMATASDDLSLIRNEFNLLRRYFEKHKSKDFSILSMGMTSDYKIALEEGSTMVRIGSAIFGDRIWV